MKTIPLPTIYILPVIPGRRRRRPVGEHDLSCILFKLMISRLLGIVNPNPHPIIQIREYMFQVGLLSRARGINDFTFSSHEIIAPTPRSPDPLAYSNYRLLPPKLPTSSPPPPSPPPSHWLLPLESESESKPSKSENTFIPPNAPKAFPCLFKSCPASYQDKANLKKHLDIQYPSKVAGHLKLGYTESEVREKYEVTQTWNRAEGQRNIKAPKMKDALARYLVQ
jgi:hypothetical protein